MWKETPNLRKSEKKEKLTELLHFHMIDSPTLVEVFSQCQTVVKHCLWVYKMAVSNTNKQENTSKKPTK